MGDKHDYLSGALPSRTCKICGKKFVSTYNWMYKIIRRTTSGNYSSYDWYCSYTCYRKDGGDSGTYIHRYPTGRKKREY